MLVCRIRERSVFSSTGCAKNSLTGVRLPAPGTPARFDTPSSRIRTATESLKDPCNARGAVISECPNENSQRTSSECADGGSAHARWHRMKRKLSPRRAPQTRSSSKAGGPPAPTETTVFPTGAVVPTVGERDSLDVRI